MSTKRPEKKKEFNITGICFPDKHYMVNIDNRLQAMRELVEQGKYFVLNRARQYGKTTTLNALGNILQKDYCVISVDFQILDTSRFKNSEVFAKTFSRLFLHAVESQNQDNIRRVIQEWNQSMREEDFSLYEMFLNISAFCDASERPVVLIIDEVDSASDNQVFLDFLAQLRAYYLRRDSVPALQSVILASVYDIKNLKSKLPSEEGSRTNSPWNIAVDFTMDMSFSEEDICSMLSEYEQDRQTGMDTGVMAKLLYDETAGYPFLVCRLCKIMDEELVGTDDFQTASDAWTKEGFLAAERMLLAERNTLFDSLSHQMEQHPELKDILHIVLLDGGRVSFNAYNEAIGIGTILGFLKEADGQTVVSNRVFETWLIKTKLPE